MKPVKAALWKRYRIYAYAHNVYYVKLRIYRPGTRYNPFPGTTCSEVDTRSSSRAINLGNNFIGEIQEHIFQRYTSLCYQLSGLLDENLVLARKAGAKHTRNITGW